MALGLSYDGSEGSNLANLFPPEETQNFPMGQMMNRDQKQPRKLKDLLESGQVKFSDAQTVDRNLPEISDWVERRLANEPLPPRKFGRPPKGEEREATEVVSFRLPKSLVLRLDRTASEFGLSRNRFVQIAIMNMIKEPEFAMATLSESISIVSKISILEGKRVNTYPSFKKANEAFMIVGEDDLGPCGVDGQVECFA
ncbi:MAG TPA: hypothetical protein VFT46_06205 [Holophagaceae bacterium]|nr:hypothetical protein [Holophagaceae bacterium]